MVTTLTLTPQPIGSPAPYVDVLASAITAGVSRVTVWRTVKGRQYKVRGLVNVSAGGTVTTRDFEAPRDVLISYRVQHLDALGNFISWSDTATTTLPDVDGYTWFHNPLDPTTSVRLRMLAPTPGALTKPLDAEILRVLGRSLGVGFFGARGGFSNINLTALTETIEDADRFDALFGGYDDVNTVPILCVRTPSAMRLPPTLFALVGKPEQVALQPWIRGEWSAWQMAGDEISPPPEAIITALLDYADFSAFYSGGYNVFKAAYLDYEQAMRDYTIAGTV